jgi:pSer/pThr/pTyr-binding forkhead associated (FHA) protein
MATDSTPSELQAVLEAERAGLPFLVWRDGAGGQRIAQVPGDRSRVTIGRAPEADIALTWDPEVSRAHALLELIGGRWTLVDDGLSSNGSFVAGARVVGRHRLVDGDRMCFGSTVVVYREPLAGGLDETIRRPEQTARVVLTDTQRRVLIALCRPVNDSAFASPATNRQIADEVFLSVDAVKAHLRVLFDRFALGELPQNEKRAKLAATVLLSGVLAPRDF